MKHIGFCLVTCLNRVKTKFHLLSEFARPIDCLQSNGNESKIMFVMSPMVSLQQGEETDLVIYKTASNKACI